MWQVFCLFSFAKKKCDFFFLLMLLHSLREVREKSESHNPSVPEMNDEETSALPVKKDKAIKQKRYICRFLWSDF